MAPTTDQLARLFTFRVEEVDELRRFFEVLEVPTLRATMSTDGGAIGCVGFENAERYAHLAAVLECDGTDALDPSELVRLFSDCLLHIFCTDSPARRETPDGRCMLHFEGLDPIEVTQESVRHWLWSVALFTDLTLPGAYLDSLPESVSAPAREHASATTDERRTTAQAFAIMNAEGLL